MDNYVIWFVLAVLFAGAELLSGTFYLLLYGVACAAGGLVALVGLGESLQLTIAGLFGIAFTLWLRKHPIVRPTDTGNNDNIGQRVEVEQWKTDTLLRVKFRGAGWDAELSGACDGRPGALYIVGQRGNTLIVATTVDEPQINHQV